MVFAPFGTGFCLLYYCTLVKEWQPLFPLDLFLSLLKTVLFFIFGALAVLSSPALRALCFFEAGEQGSSEEHLELMNYSAYAPGVDFHPAHGRIRLIFYDGSRLDEDRHCL
jgi:hypothetical protein